jgi:hypothetical protein
LLSARAATRVARHVPCAPGVPVDRQIRAYLAGKGDGAELLHALYDPILDEPVPERLSALVKR